VTIFFKNGILIDQLKHQEKVTPSLHKLCKYYNIPSLVSGYKKITHKRNGLTTEIKSSANYAAGVDNKLCAIKIC